MSSDWKRVKLDQALCINPKVPMIKGKEYPFVEMSSVEANNKNVKAKEIRTFKGSGSRFVEGDTIMARITPCLQNGKISRYKAFNQEKHAHGSTEFIVLRHRENITHKEFVYYLTISDQVKPYAISQMNGSSGRQRVPVDSFKHLEINLPPIAEQKAIADILSSLDEKIELNRQICKTLEDIASTLFKSWFIDFDPVKAKAEGRAPEGISPETAALFPDSFEDSPKGRIPKGWKLTTLKEVALNFDSKRIPLSNREREKRRGYYPYHGATGVLDYLDDYIFDGIYLLLGEDGSVVKEDGTPFTQYVRGKFWVNNHAHVLQGIYPISTEHLYLFIRQLNISPFITGAVQPKLNQKNMYSIPFVKPDKEICRHFAKIVSPLFERIYALRQEIKSLEKIKNSLIPELLIGKIRMNKGTGIK
ncbi:MAG: restriction endonuclease subunit S [Waddliaceae bacterium]